MSESVEQAALRRASEDMDWKARAEREAAAIIAEVNPSGSESYALLVSLVSIGWLQGMTFGLHRALAGAETAFDEVRAAL